MMFLSSLPVNYSAFLHQGTPLLPSKFPGRVDYHRDVSLTPQTAIVAYISQLIPLTLLHFYGSVHVFLAVIYHSGLHALCLQIFRIKTRQKHANHSCTKIVTSAARNDHHLSYDDLPEEPFLLTLIKDALWELKSLFVFLVEQPGQLKYIEWPSFSSTLRTAVLTLVLVALLIVALSSVDSALCYLLALALRKSP